MQTSVHTNHEVVRQNRFPHERIYIPMYKIKLQIVSDNGYTEHKPPISGGGGIWCVPMKKSQAIDS